MQNRMLRVKPSLSKRSCFLISTGLLFMICLVSFLIYEIQPDHIQFSTHPVWLHNRINPTLIHPVLDHPHPNTKQTNNGLLDTDRMHENGTQKSGYGIVYTGTIELLPLIYISLSILKRLGLTSYPVEIFVNDDDSNTTIHKCQTVFIDEFSLVFPHIRCISLHERPTRMYSYKILSLLRSSFEHVLFLDCDNIIIQSPSVLFQSVEYKFTDAIFWTDLWGANCDGLFKGGRVLYASCLERDGIYSKLNPTYIKYNKNDLRYSQSQEAGQLVINTRTYYDTLKAVLECTESSEYQMYLHGDKDCFRFMFMERDEPFYYNNIMPQYVGYTYENWFYRYSVLQFWKNANNVMFIHQTKYPKDHRLWQYYQEMTVDWTCPVDDGQDLVFPFPMEDKYVIRETKYGKKNGALVDKLEDVWKAFWEQYHSLYD